VDRGETAHVTALDFNDEVSEAAAKLTKRCGLSHRLTHVVGDITDNTLELPHSAYDLVFSKLCILHNPFESRPAIWKAIAKLAPGGHLYLEDYFLAGTLTEQEQADLLSIVSTPPPPTKQDYIQQLSEVPSRAGCAQNVVVTKTYV
jgi:predicted O-methyltransferase YrrM